MNYNVDINNLENIYSEVNAILNLLGHEYIRKIPGKMYKLILENKSDTYIPIYYSVKDIYNGNISRKALSVIATLHLKYWCNSFDEKEELKKIFNDNQIKNEEIKSKKYSYENLFKNKKKINIQEMKELIVVEKDNLFKRILSKIKSFFRR